MARPRKPKYEYVEQLPQEHLPIGSHRLAHHTAFRRPFFLKIFSAAVDIFPRYYYGMNRKTAKQQQQERNSS